MNTRTLTVVTVASVALVTAGVVTAQLVTADPGPQGPQVPVAWTTPAPDRQFEDPQTGVPTAADRASWEVTRAEGLARAQEASRAALEAWQAEQARAAAEAAARAAAEAEAAARAQAQGQAPAQPGGTPANRGSGGGAPASSGGGGAPAPSGGGGAPAPAPTPELPPSGSQAYVTDRVCTIHDGHYDLTGTISFDNGYSTRLTIHNDADWLGELSTQGRWYPAYVQFDCPPLG
jgi:hypothetical protein